MPRSARRARDGFRMLRKPYDIKALRQTVGEMFETLETP